MALRPDKLKQIKLFLDKEKLHKHVTYEAIVARRL
jgi:hypothetical protein